jgi:hypothetical protein
LANAELRLSAAARDTLPQVAASSKGALTCEQGYACW